MTRTWRKSSHSGASNDCVELAVTGTGTAVRDTKNRGAGTLAFTTAGWSAFVAGLKRERAR